MTLYLLAKDTFFMGVIPTEDQYAADSIGSLEMDSFRELQELMIAEVFN